MANMFVGLQSFAQVFNRTMGKDDLIEKGFYAMLEMYGRVDQF